MITLKGLKDKIDEIEQIALEEGYSADELYLRDFQTPIDEVNIHFVSNNDEGTFINIWLKEL